MNGIKMGKSMMGQLSSARLREIKLADEDMNEGWRMWLTTHGNEPYIYYEITKKNTNVRKKLSSKTNDEVNAAMNAEKVFIEIRNQYNATGSVNNKLLSKTFSHYCDIIKTQQPKNLEIAIIKRLFGDVKVTELSEQSFPNFYKTFTDDFMNRKKRMVAQASLEKFLSNLRKIITLSSNDGLIKHFQIAPIKIGNTILNAKKRERRPELTDDEFSNLEIYLLKIVQEKQTYNDFDITVNAAYLLFLMYSGIRPGTEALSISFDTMIEKNNVYEFTITSGKIGNTYTAQCLNKFKPILEHLKTLYQNNSIPIVGKVFKRNDGSNFVPSSKKTLRELMSRGGVKDKDKLIPYAIRHTFARKLVEKGVPLNRVALQLNTSVLMLDRFYVQKNKGALDGIDF